MIQKLNTFFFFKIKFYIQLADIHIYIYVHMYGKYRKNLQCQIPTDCVFNLTKSLQKMEIISHYY